MTSDFAERVQATIGPTLSALGFALDAIDDNSDEGGIVRHVVYYRSGDCKMQVYESAREGETNCMIGSLNAPNGFGLTSPGWHHLSKFSRRSDLSPEERLLSAIAEASSYSDPLLWVRDRIDRFYQAAHAAVISGNN